MVTHLPRSGMDFLLHNFNLSSTLHSFPSGRHLSLFSSIKSDSLSTLLLPCGLSLSPPAYQSFLNASHYLVFSSFRNVIQFSLPARLVSSLDVLLLIKLLSLLSPFWMDLTSLGRGLGRSCLLSISRRLLTLAPRSFQ